MKTSTFWKINITMAFLLLLAIVFKLPKNPYGYIWTVTYAVFIIYFSWKVIKDFKTIMDLPIVPMEGYKIKMTWFPHCRNVPSYVPNPYIGMEGIATDVKTDGSFILKGETNSLVVTGKYKFEYIYE